MKYIAEMITEINLKLLSRGFLFLVALMVLVPSVWATTTNFYVDPAYTGPNPNGTATNPWTTLGRGSSTAWAQINTALASNIVTVYFSARRAASDTPENYGGELLVYRTDTSNNLLTLDGMSEYNSNEAAPQWTAYTGINKLQVYEVGSEIALGWVLLQTLDQSQLTTAAAACGISTSTLYSDLQALNWISSSGNFTQSPTYPITVAQLQASFPSCYSSVQLAIEQAQGRISNVTLNGFEVYGPYSRVSVGGSNVTVSNLYVHDTQKIGAAVALQYATSPQASCNITIGSVTNVTFENNIVERTYGDAFYIGGTNYCPNYGLSHNNILIKNNTVIDAGYYGVQGNGFDIKDGLTNVTITGNFVSGSLVTGVGVQAVGTYCNAPAVGDPISTCTGLYNQNLVIENNILDTGVGSGIVLASGYLENPNPPNDVGAGVMNGTTVFNNVIYGNTKGGIDVTGTTDSESFNANVNIFNNTIYGNIGPGISIYDFNGVNLMNNLVWGNDPEYPVLQMDKQGTVSDLASNYNMFTVAQTQEAWGIEGSNSQVVTGPGIVNASGNNFQLQSSSPAIGAGLNLTSDCSNIPALCFDMNSNARPATGNWDIGAYQYSSTSTILPKSSDVIFGDVNGDGQVTIVDAELTAQEAIGIPVPNFNTAAAEVDGTSTVDIYDAFLIAEYAVGIINKFPVQQ